VVQLIDRDWFSGGRNIAEDPDAKRELADLIIELQTAANQALATGSGLCRRVDGSRTDAYTPDGSALLPFKTIQAAIDSITDASAIKRYLVTVAPGIYPEAVTMKRWITLAGEGGAFAVGRLVEIATAAGFSLSVPWQGCCLQGISAATTSANPADAAIRVYDDGLPYVGESSFGVLTYGRSSGLARALLVQPNPMGEAFVGVWFAADGGPGGVAIEADGAGFIWFSGGGGGDARRQLYVHNGGMALLNAGPIVAASSSDPLAYAIECDGGGLICLDAVIGGFNGIRLTNGGMALLPKASSFGGFPGVPVHTDVGTTLLLGAVNLDPPGGPPWFNWIVNGAAFVSATGEQGIGTAVLPVNQRPAGVPLGFRFFALDLAGGAGLWLTWNGAAWVDPAGVPVP
jgi:hypothetical protein